LDKSHLLLCGIPAPALNPGKDFNSISIRRHSRNTRRKPSSYLGDCVRFKWGLLHHHSTPPDTGFGVSDSPQGRAEVGSA
jgi:hypothetical protein